MRLAALLVAALALAGLPAAGAAAFSFDRAFPDQPLRGPEKARAAVIWNHGKSPDRDESNNPPARLALLLSGGGYDVFLLRRPLKQDNLTDSSAALDDAVDRLWAQGYRNIVLGGQSYGAWISLDVAGRNSRVSAVVANAPAAYGSRERAGYERNATRLYDVLHRIRPVRVVLSFFDGDDFDPGGRASEARRILDSRRVPHLVLDRPRGFHGHGSGNSGLFARRFGHCIETVIDGGPLPTPAGCDRPWGDSPSGELVLPPTDAVATAGAPFAGRWWGTCLNGRETVLTVGQVSPAGAVDATYGIGPSLDGRTLARTSPRRGRVEGDRLVFDEAGLASIIYSRNANGTLSGVWKATADAPMPLLCTLKPWAGS